MHIHYYKNKSIAKRYETRLEKSSPIFDAFINYVDLELKNALPKSPLGQALEYSKKLLPSFRTFLDDGSLEIDNNSSERSIKAFVIGRNYVLESIIDKIGYSAIRLKEPDPVQLFIA